MEFFLNIKLNLNSTGHEDKIKKKKTNSKLFSHSLCIMVMELA